MGKLSLVREASIHNETVESKLYKLRALTLRRQRNRTEFSNLLCDYYNTSPEPYKPSSAFFAASRRGQADKTY